VIDLFSRRVVGWSVSVAMTAQLVTDALLSAVWRRGRPVGQLHHSDQGSPYTSEQFLGLMADHGIFCSMSRSDSAAVQSLLARPVAGWRAAGTRVVGVLGESHRLPNLRDAHCGC
jgi:putative transposase